MKTELKEKVTGFMKKELTITGINFVLIAAVMLLAGICIGLLIAPFTHGLSIFSNNGNNNGNNNRSGDEDAEDDDEQAC